MNSTSQDNHFNKKRGLNFKAALNGLFFVFKSERSFQIELLLGVITLCVGLLIGLNTIEWIIILLCISSVLVLEIINTIIEHIMDFIHPQYHKQVGIIKDMGSTLVFVNCIIVFVIACIILAGKILI